MRGTISYFYFELLSDAMVGVDSQISSAKSGFAMKFNTLLWILTTGLQFVVGWWYRRQAVFYLPEGWFGPLGWWLSLPFAPAGMCSNHMH